MLSYANPWSPPAKSRVANVSGECVMMSQDSNQGGRSGVRKIHPVQSLWVTSDLFTLTNEVKANFEVKTINGRECVKLNVLFDSGATLNLISKSIVDIMKAKTGSDAN